MFIRWSFHAWHRDGHDEKIKKIKRVERKEIPDGLGLGLDPSPLSKMEYYYRQIREVKGCGAQPSVSSLGLDGAYISFSAQWIYHFFSWLTGC